MRTPQTMTARNGRCPLAAGLALLLAAAAARAAEPSGATPATRTLHRIGVLAHRPKPQVLDGWRPLGVALEKALPDLHFTVEVLDYAELDAAIADRRIDLVITNPGHYVGIRTRQPLSGVLATVLEQAPGVVLPSFGGAILVRSDRRDLASLADLRDARIAVVSSASLGGYQAQAYELRLAGVELPPPSRLLTTGMPHDRVVEAVLAGLADAGFARSGTIEAMVAEGRLDRSRLTVLNRQDLPHFPYEVSTRLYPEWPVVALAHLDPDHARRIAAALLSMDHTAPGGLGAYQGFAIPADYSAVETLLRELRLPPFDAAPVFGAGDVFRRYQVPVAAFALAALVIVVLAVFLAVANLRLTRARRRADVTAATLAQVLATASIGIAKVRQRRQLWVNPKQAELFGYHPAELEGAATRRFYPDDATYERVGRESRAALDAGQTYVTELPLQRKDGTQFWARLRGSPVAAPGEAGESIWTVEDVTDRRAVEAELRQVLATNEATMGELREALSRVKALSGLLPICMYCHKIRADQGYWHQLEAYISAHSEALFSHGICPACFAARHGRDPAQEGGTPP